MNSNDATQSLPKNAQKSTQNSSQIAGQVIDQGIKKNSGTLMPSVFWSHGTPMLALAEDGYTEALQSFAQEIEKPKAIVIVSPFGTSEPGTVRINASKRPGLQYNFGNFPGEIYQIEYPCPGSPELSVRIASMLSSAGFQAELNSQGGLDAGAWMPVRVAYPEADIPVIQISMPYPTEPQWILKMGKTLAPLRQEGVLLVGSGAAVYNIEKIVWYMKTSPGESWAQEFEDWLKQQLKAKNVEAMVDFEKAAPHSALALPEAKHFFPLFFTLGAAWPGDEAVSIYEGIQYKTLSMFSFALVNPNAAGPGGIGLPPQGTLLS